MIGASKSIVSRFLFIIPTLARSGETGSASFKLPPPCWPRRVARRLASFPQTRLDMLLPWPGKL